MAYYRVDLKNHKTCYGRLLRFYKPYAISQVLLVTLHDGLEKLDRALF